MRGLKLKESFAHSQSLVKPVSKLGLYVSRAHDLIHYMTLFPYNNSRPHTLFLRVQSVFVHDKTMLAPAQVQPLAEDALGPCMN